MEVRDAHTHRSGGGHGRPDAARDAEFSAYMAARQPSLMRTAYLLTGDRHQAEDLVQTSLAKLYLAWDQVQRPRLGRRLRPPDPGQREQLAVAPRLEAARARHRPGARAPRPATTYDEGRSRRAVGRRPDAAEEGAGRGRAPLLRGAHRGRDRRRARHLGRHREVPDQPGAGRPARTRTPATSTPGPGGGAMTPTPTAHDLERELGRQLHDQVDHRHDAPLGLGDVQGRAGRIRRNRRLAVAAGGGRRAGGRRADRDPRRRPARPSQEPDPVRPPGRGARRGPHDAHPGRPDARWRRPRSSTSPSTASCCPTRASSSSR